MDADSSFRPFAEDDDRSRDPTEGVRIIGAEEAEKAIERGDVASRLPQDLPKFGDRPAQPEGPRPPLSFPLPNSRAGATALPHWTDPPTGEVPKLLPDDVADGARRDSEDLEAWSSFAGPPRWRERSGEWDDDDDLSALGDEGTRIGALGSRPDRPDLEPDEPLVEVDDMTGETVPVQSIRTGARASGARSTGTRRPAAAAGAKDAGRDLPVAVGVGVALAVVAIVLMRIGPGATMVLVTGVLVVAAAEFFTVLRRASLNPATLVGVAATASLALAAYWKGEPAYPIVLFLTVVVGLLWYLWADPADAPVANLGVTLLGVGWVGVLGSFAALLLTLPDGTSLLLCAALGTVAYDVFGYAVGRSSGHSRMSPTVSPNKTYEGLVGGMVAALVVSVAAVGLGIGDQVWDGIVWDGVLLGVVIAVAAPLGDLCESLLKRDLGVKDMSGLLPGHGGLLDRFDALLFVLPAVYCLARITLS